MSEEKDQATERTALPVEIRWLIRRDMPEVLAIEKECFPDPWGEEHFETLLRQRNTIGIVAESDGKIVGFQIYELQPGLFHVVTMAVATLLRRRGIGTQMMSRLINKLSDQPHARRQVITAFVPESNLSAQLFLRNAGFRANEIYRGEPEDSYLFRYAARAIDDARVYHPRNRISSWKE